MSVNRHYELLEEFRSILRGAGRDSDEDALLEVMDMVSGWISPPATSALPECGKSGCEDQRTHWHDDLLVRGDKAKTTVLTTVLTVTPGGETR